MMMMMMAIMMIDDDDVDYDDDNNKIDADDDYNDNKYPSVSKEKPVEIKRVFLTSIQHFCTHNLRNHSNIQVLIVEYPILLPLFILKYIQ